MTTIYPVRVWTDGRWHDVCRPRDLAEALATRKRLARTGGRTYRVSTDIERACDRAKAGGR